MATMESTQEGTKWASKVTRELAHALPHLGNLKGALEMAGVDDANINHGAIHMCSIAMMHARL